MTDKPWKRNGAKLGFISVDLETLRVCLGHEDIATTQKYLHALIAQIGVKGKNPAPV